MALVFRLCLLLMLISPALAVLCNPADKKALLQLKHDLNDPYLLASWSPDTDCCYWYTVKCDRKTHRIISLSILNSVPDTNFSSQIPPSIADLPYLQTLILHKLPNLTGPLPPAISKLTSLSYLTISWTNLSGPVPDSLARLQNLQFLDLSFNNLSGPIPGSLSLLPKLISLSLDRNKLTGPIPDSFGSFNSSPALFLSHNQLSGRIPPSLANQDPSRIELQRNRLEGDAYMLFGPNKTTQMVDLSRNLLSFDVGRVEFPASLISLDLNHNMIYGTLPQGLKAVDFLQMLNVSYNRMCGEIPQGGRLQRFDVSAYFHNKCLCGSPLPACKGLD
ncbi:polygalacturonase inhibitor-like [Prosopis cineraria]|uniref:polygalacturonase inhibitor-like n=1 Tax=Prosopis cineraria TaxID=364024 RepID=UPI00240F10E0|nr:polygalacturonase inhibitor-like [Prosopis cineraria]